ncbi:hypothetical protein K439DRAFT_1653936 [Ramaria rubella]|nr:hypothetical protein K439DRAFT_1653936 [Ramaria rubella]
MSLPPPLDYTRFQWRPSPDDCRLYIREAAGGEAIEDVWNRFKNGEQTLFFGLDLRLQQGIHSQSLLSHGRTAWAQLRFAVPTVAARTAYDTAGNTLITYRAAESESEVDAWAKRTLRLSEDTRGLDHVRYELGKVHIPEENGDQTFLYIVPGADEKTYSLLLHTSHIPFDGAGSQILMNKFLIFLSHAIAGDIESSTLNWGTEAKNLLPSVSEVLGPEELRDGEQFMNTLGSIMGELGAAMPRQYGFKQRSIGPGPNSRLGYDFSAEESKKILNAARNLGFTINHVAHAAISIVAALDNPRTSGTSEDKAFVFYGLVDARKRLTVPYSARDGYPGYCIAMSAIQVPLHLCPSDPFSSAKELRESMLRIAPVLKTQYLKQKAYPSLLAMSTQQVEMMLAGMRAGDPPPPPWMGPWYTSHGIVETYLDAVHTDRAGGQVLEITDIMLSLNKTDPGPFFRTLSWRGRLKLSVDTNEVAMPPDVVQRFMDKWVEILRMLVDA